MRGASALRSIVVLSTVGPFMKLGLTTVTALIGQGGLGPAQVVAQLPVHDATRGHQREQDGQQQTGQAQDMGPALPPLAPTFERAAVGHALERLGAKNGNVINTMIDEVLTDGVMPIHREGNLEFGADAIDA